MTTGKEVGTMATLNVADLAAEQREIWQAEHENLDPRQEGRR
jgi:hypothetical protein